MTMAAASEQRSPHRFTNRLSCGMVEGPGCAWGLSTTTGYKERGVNDAGRGDL